MQVLTDIIGALTADEKAYVLEEVKHRTSLPHRLLAELLGRDDAGAVKHIQAALKVSAPTLAKLGTQAKDLLIELVSRCQQTDFDGIALIRQMLFRGKTELALKMAADAEKQCEEKQLWQHLELLYIETYRYCQITGNQKLLESYIARRSRNAARLDKYIALSGLLIRELVRLEGFKLKPTVRDYFSQLKKLEKQAVQLGHYTLIANVYTLQYLYLMRFTTGKAAVAEVVSRIEKLYKQKSRYVQNNTRLIAINSHLNFLSQYITRQDPNAAARRILPDMEKMGTFVASNLCYAMCEYNLHVFNFKLLDEWLQKLEKYKDEGKFRLFVHAVNAARHFAKQQFGLFKKDLDLFFADAANHNFPDTEVQLRLLELILLKKQGDEDLLSYKTEALRQFMTRHVSKERYYYEWTILNLFKKKKAGAADVSKVLKALGQSPHYNILFLKELLHRNLAGNQ